MRQLGSVAFPAILPPDAGEVRCEISPAKADFQSGLDKILVEIEDIKGQTDNIPLVPETSTKQKNDSSAGPNYFEFRPLTEVEKKEFFDALDAKGRQKLAELAGETKSSSGPADDVVPLCCL